MARDMGVNCHDSNTTVHVLQPELALFCPEFKRVLASQFHYQTIHTSVANTYKFAKSETLFRMHCLCFKIADLFDRFHSTDYFGYKYDEEAWKKSKVQTS